MSEISIISPKLEIKILEIEEYIPSFKLSMYHNVEGMGYKNTYYQEFWVKNNVWETFVNCINKNEKAVLFDMGDNEKIIVNGDFLSLFFQKTDSLSFVESKCIYKISEEEKNVIMKNFLFFPKWW